MDTLKRKAGRLLAIAVFLTAAPVCQADTEITSSKSIPLDGLILPHPCAFQPMAFSGSLQVQTKVTLGAAGAMVGLRVDIQGVAATEKNTGVRYGSQDFGVAVLNMGPLPSARTQVMDFRFSRPGGADKFRAYISLHVTADPDGTVAVSVEKVQLECS